MRSIAAARERRAAEVRVDDDAGGVDDRPQRPLEALRQPARWRRVFDRIGAVPAGLARGIRHPASARPRGDAAGAASAASRSASRVASRPYRASSAATPVALPQLIDGGKDPGVTTSPRRSYPDPSDPSLARTPLDTCYASGRVPCRMSSRTTRPLERFWPYVEKPEEPTAEELAALDPDLHAALFGPRDLPFSITRRVRSVRRARLRARGGDGEGVGGISRGGRGRPTSGIARDSSRATRCACATCTRWSAAQPHVRRADRRPARCPYARDLWLPLVWFLLLRTRRLTDAAATIRVRSRVARPGSRAQAARSGVQHVLRRPAAAPALGPACACRRDDEALRSHAHPEHRRPLPLPDRAGAMGGVHRVVGAAAEGAGDGTAAWPRPIGVACAEPRAASATPPRPGAPPDPSAAAPRNASWR